MGDSRYACCDDILLDFSKIELPLTINFKDANFWWAALCIGFNPLFWNLVARNEFYNGTLTRLFCSPFRGVCALAITIVLLGLYRDWRFDIASRSHAHWDDLNNYVVLYMGYGLIVYGMTLVLTSFWKLGFTGTFLGDYFGLLLPVKVEDFPFNIFSDPMYVGSTMNFVGLSLIRASQAGLLLSLWVAIVYRIATLYEGPFTEMIYAEGAKRGDKNRS